MWFLSLSYNESISSDHTPVTSLKGPGNPPKKHRSFSSTIPLQKVVTKVPPFLTNSLSLSATPGFTI